MFIILMLWGDKRSQSSLPDITDEVENSLFQNTSLKSIEEQAEFDLWPLHILTCMYNPNHP